MKRLHTILGILCCLASFSFAQIQVSTLVDEIDASGGVKVATNGHIFVADFGESLDNANGTNVWEITPAGDVSLFATGFFGASGNAFDSQGNLYQSNIAGGYVSKITPRGMCPFFATDNISANVGIAIDPDDNLYVCNCGGPSVNTIAKVTPEGVSTTFATGFILNCPNGITIDNNQTLYVSNFSDGNIIKVTPGGAVSILASTPGTSNSFPSNGHIVYSPFENVLYVASHGAHNIYRVTLSGEISLFAGSSTRGNDDGPALEATFSRPNGLALSLTGDTLYLNSSIPTTDEGGRPLNPSKIRMITGLLSNTATSTLPPALANVRISPNPTTDLVSVSLSENIDQTLYLKLLDAQGKTLHRQQIDNQITELSLEAYPAGLYYIWLSDGTSSTLKKIIRIN